MRPVPARVVQWVLFVLVACVLITSAFFTLEAPYSSRSFIRLPSWWRPPTPIQALGSGVPGLSSSLCVGLDLLGEPCICSRSCLLPGSLAPCSLPQSTQCFDQSPVQEYEYLPLYRHQHQPQQQRRNYNHNHNHHHAPHGTYSTIDPPSNFRDGNCAMTFRHVQLVDGNRLIIFANDSYIDKQFSLHSNAVLMFDRIALSTVGNPMMNRYSIAVKRETKDTYKQHQHKCTKHHRTPYFLLGTRDHVLGNFYHFHSEFWHLSFFTMANPWLLALHPVPPVPRLGARDSGSGSDSDSDSRVTSISTSTPTLAWSSSNSTILHWSGGQSYESFAVRVSDFTEGRPMQPVLTHRQTRTGVECFDQITLGLENTMHLYQTTHIRRQAQPLIDWADWRYNVSLPFTGRMHGWKVFRDSLVPSASNPDSRPHVVISTRTFPGRFLHNMSSVISVFERHGFRVSTVFFTPIPIQQTIELIRTAHVFMQVHGAGLSNSLFLHAGSTLIQLLNPIHPLHKPVFPRLAWNVGAHYLEMKISERKDSSVQIDNWREFEDVVARARDNTRALLRPEATWSPTRPTLFERPTAPMLAQCGVPEVSYHNDP